MKHCETCTCGCTCGYGGFHEPENEACELNKSDEERTAEAQAWLDHVNSFPKDSSCRRPAPTSRWGAR